MSRPVRRLLCLALILLLCAPAPAACAEQETASVPVYVDGLLRLRGFDCAGTLFLSAADICRLFRLRAEESLDENGYTLRIGTLELSAPAGEEVFTADGRYLYCPGGYRQIGDRVCLAAETVEHLFGLRVHYEGERAEIDTSRFRLLKGGETYYTAHVNAEDLFWMSRILYAEAHWEPLAGMIGVGNVVLNRVRSDEFPATVMAVVLDREGRTQFTPVETTETVMFHSPSWTMSFFIPPKYRAKVALNAAMNVSARENTRISLATSLLTSTSE